MDPRQMPVRPPGAAGKRTEVCAVRLTRAEAADLDGARGDLSRSEYLRLLLTRERRRRSGVDGLRGDIEM